MSDNKQLRYYDEADIKKIADSCRLIGGEDVKLTVSEMGDYLEEAYIAGSLPSGEFIQPDWAATTVAEGAIKNKPSIKKGDGVNSLVIGDGDSKGKNSVTGCSTDSNELNKIKNMAQMAGYTVDTDKATAYGDSSLSLGVGTKAYSMGSMAIGISNSAGAKGFYWHSIDWAGDKPVIQLSIEQKPYRYYKVLGQTIEQNKTAAWNTEASTLLSSWVVGDKLTIVNNNKYGEGTVITSIDTTNGKITVESLPFAQTDVKVEFSSLSDISNLVLSFDDFSIYNPSKPASGLTEFAYGALSLGLMTNAAGSFSTALGYGSKVVADFGHAEGRRTIAGYASHAEGVDTKALGLYSHAEGYNTEASGQNTHAEGQGTKATAIRSHAEGYNTEATHENTHAEGIGSKAVYYHAHAEGANTTSSGEASHAEGLGTESGAKAYRITDCNVEELSYTLSSIDNIKVGDTVNITIWEKIFTTSGHSYYTDSFNTIISSLDEENNKVFIKDNFITVHNYDKPNLLINYSNKNVGTNSIGIGAHAEGKNTKALYNYSHAEGYGTEAFNDAAHAEGKNTTASGEYSHAEGGYTTASGNYSHTEGIYSKANGHGSHTEGGYTTASGIYQHVQGKYNIEDTGNKYAHIIGNGTSDTSRSSAHTLDWDGSAWYKGSITSNGADYAEYFEWLDGNVDNEDRIGLLVALDGEKIKLANNGDEILGIISGTAAVLGDNYECEWNGKYLTDDFGRVIYDLVEEFVDVEHIEFKEVKKEIIDEETKETRIEIELEEVKTTEKQSLGFWKHPRLNPDYDPEQKYINRLDRPEWDTVGMLGKLYVRDDGTCQVNGYITVGENGVATASSDKTNMRVLSRVNENVIRILLK